MALTWTVNIADGQIITSDYIIQIRNNINVELTRREKATFNFVQPVNTHGKINAIAIDELRNAMSTIDPNHGILAPIAGVTIITNEYLDSFRNVLNNLNAVPVYRWAFGPWEYIYESFSGPNARFFIFDVKHEGEARNRWGMTYNVNNVKEARVPTTAAAVPFDGQYNGYDFYYRRIYTWNGSSWVLTTFDTNIMYRKGNHVYTWDVTDKYGRTLQYFYQIQRGVYTQF